MPDDTVLLKLDGPLATLTLNRPGSLNALNDDLRAGLACGLETISRDASVRVAILTGAGRGFCSGGDLKFLEELRKNHQSMAFRDFLEAGHRVVRSLRSLPKPVIASINGPAFGGGMNLALACDLRIASDRATFSQAFVKVGLHPDWGGTFLLPRLAGTGRAMEMFYLGDSIDAAEALRLGLVNFVVSHEKLVAETQSLAERLAAGPALSLGLMKQAMYERLETQLDSMMEHEVEAQMKCFESRDFEEGLRAFLEKRKPKFGGS
ncbi:MAG: enoyl-CoA hydratase/isomerase family protein [Deltaproteobacteria bacterium]